jgi:hypothetical protein
MSIYDCPVKGEAQVQRINDAPAWLRSDPEVHITDELLEDCDAMSFVSERYEVAEPCPYARGLHHARLTTTAHLDHGDLHERVAQQAAVAAEGEA